MNKKYTPRGMIAIELANIRRALIEGRAIARLNDETLNHWEPGIAALPKISKLVNQLIKNIDEAKYDGMKAQREVDKMIGRR